MTTFDRKTKKESYFWYKAKWSEDPVLYLTQRRNTNREKKETSVTVYFNIGAPKVYLDGKELTGVRKGYTMGNTSGKLILMKTKRNTPAGNTLWDMNSIYY